MHSVDFSNMLESQASTARVITISVKVTFYGRTLYDNMQLKL